SRLQAVPEGITTGHERGARRRTHRLHIEFFELRPASCELVQIWRLDIRAMKTDVLPAEIVCNDVKNVWLTRNFSCGRLVRLRISRTGSGNKGNYRRASGECLWDYFHVYLHVAHGFARKVVRQLWGTQFI